MWSWRAPGLVWVLLFSLLKLAVPCLPSGASNSVSAGGDTYICIVLSPLTWGVVSPATTNKFLRIPAKVKSDDFTRINVEKSWTSTDYTADAITSLLSVSATDGNGVGISVSSMGVTSYQKAYRLVGGTTAKTFPMLMVLITVDKGKVVVSSRFVWKFPHSQKMDTQTLL